MVYYTLLIAGVMLWGSLIGYRFVIEYVAPSIVTFIIGTVLFAIGITLPAKQIFAKINLGKKLAVHNLRSFLAGTEILGIYTAE